MNLSQANLMMVFLFVGLLIQPQKAFGIRVCSSFFSKSAGSGQTPSPSWAEQLRLERGESVLVTSKVGLPHIYHFLGELKRGDVVVAMLLRESRGREIEVPLASIKNVERAQAFFARGERLRIQWVESDGRIMIREGSFQGIERGMWRFQDLNSASEWNVSVDILRAARVSRRGGIKRLDATFWSAKLALVRGEDKVEALSWQGAYQGVFIDEFHDRFILLRDRVIIEIDKSQLMKVGRIREFTIPLNSRSSSFNQKFESEKIALSADPSQNKLEFMPMPAIFLQTGSFSDAAYETWARWALALNPDKNAHHAAWLMGYRDPKALALTDLKNSYRRLAKRLHPDLNHDKALSEQKIAEEILKQVNRAYQLLEARLGSQQATSTF